MKKQSEYQSKYDAKTARRFQLKLHKVYDKDVIDMLEKQDSVQGYIKLLVRKDISSKE